MTDGPMPKNGATRSQICLQKKKRMHARTKTRNINSTKQPMSSLNIFFIRNTLRWDYITARADGVESSLEDKKMKKVMVFVLAAILMGSLAALWAQGSKSKGSAPPPVVAKGKEGKTVFVDISGFGRKDHAAKKMTEIHEEMRVEGFTVIDMTPYTENGDLEGFFVTYVR